MGLPWLFLPRNDLIYTLKMNKQKKVAKVFLKFVDMCIYSSVYSCYDS